MNLSSVWEHIERVAEERLAHNKTSRHVDTDYLEVIGAAGELAARHLLGLPTTLHTNFDGGKDLMWAGYSVDVKTTRLTPLVGYRFLQWPVYKKAKADIVLLMAVDQRNMTVVPIGWATRQEILDAPINYDRSSPCHEIPVTRLRPFWELFSLRLQRDKELKTDGLSILH